MAALTSEVNEANYELVVLLLSTGSTTTAANTIRFITRVEFSLHGTG